MKQLIYLFFIFELTYADSFVLNIENDFINDTDRHLTNRVEFSWMFDTNTTKYNQLGFTITHDTFTPEDDAKNKTDYDMPYAGYLYGNLNFYFLKENYLNSIGIGIGTIGKYSYAKQFQTEFHKIIGANKPLGWDNQIGDKTTYNINYN